MLECFYKLQNEYGVKIKQFDEHIEVYKNSHFLFSVDTIEELKKELQNNHK